MRRTLVALLALAPVLLGAAPASAAGPAAGPATASGAESGADGAESGAAGGGPGVASGAGWEPAPPTPPTDYAAGERCDFPVHGEPVVDEVVQRVLETHPDGSPKRVAYKGDLVVRVTNTDTGVSYDADASGTAVVDYRTDGSQFWSVLGPVLANFRENGGDLPRGLYILDGLYTLDIDATGYKDLTMLHGTHDNLCDRIG